MISLSAIKTGLLTVPFLAELPVFTTEQDERVGTPVRHLRITPSGGYGELMEGVLLNQEWQFRSVGDQSNYDDAWDIAWAIDQLVLSWSGTDVGGVRVVVAQRSGSPPTYLLEDESGRTHFVCSYLLDVE